MRWAARDCGTRNRRSRPSTVTVVLDCSTTSPGAAHIKLALEPVGYGVANFTLCKAWVGTGNLHNQSEVVNVVGRIQQRDTQSFVDDLSERIAESRLKVLHHDIREEA